jgi:hypothetical protein
VADNDFERFAAIENAKANGTEPPKAPEANKDDSPSPAKSATPAPQPGESTQDKTAAPRRTPDEHKARNERRWADLLSDNARMKAELESVRNGANGRPSPPDANGKPAAEAKSQEKPARPKMRDFPDIEAYEAAMETWEEKHLDFTAAKTWGDLQGKAQKLHQEAVNAHQQRSIAETWNAREVAARKAIPDYDSAFSDGELPQLTEAMAGYVIESDIGPQLLHHLVTNTDVLQALQKLNPLRAVAALGRIEASLSEPATPAKKPIIPGGSKPPTELSGRKSAPADERGAAIAAGDFESYARIENARLKAR